MPQDKVNELLDIAHSKAREKFAGAVKWGYDSEMLAVQNVLLAELIETLREKLPSP
jgi:hypothetical protein